jgi:hypothetical protein
MKWYLCPAISTIGCEGNNITSVEVLGRTSFIKGKLCQMGRKAVCTEKIDNINITFILSNDNGQHRPSQQIHVSLHVNAQSIDSTLASPHFTACINVSSQALP